MKISYRTHPILQKLKDEKLGVMPLYEGDLGFFQSRDFHDGFLKLWKDSVRHYSSEILYITEPFFNASQKAGIKLIELYRDIVRSKTVPVHFNGTIILTNGDSFNFSNEYNPQTDNWISSVFIFGKHKNDPILLACGYSTSKGYDVANDNNVPWNWWLSTEIHQSNKFNTDQDEMNFISSRLGMCTIITMFKKYAEVETLFLPPNSRAKKDPVSNEKYINDTKFPITHLDSKWFTNLVKSDAFTVRGHFRMQPCGEGMKDRKLIWISEFQKTGYTAPARRLTDKKNNEQL